MAFRELVTLGTEQNKKAHQASTLAMQAQPQLLRSAAGKNVEEVCYSRLAPQERSPRGIQAADARLTELAEAFSARTQSGFQNLALSRTERQAQRCCGRICGMHVVSEVASLTPYSFALRPDTDAERPRQASRL